MEPSIEECAAANAAERPRVEAETLGIRASLLRAEYRGLPLVPAEQALVEFCLRKRFILSPLAYYRFYKKDARRELDAALLMRLCADLVAFDPNHKHAETRRAAGLLAGNPAALSAKQTSQEVRAMLAALGSIPAYLARKAEEDAARRVRPTAASPATRMATGGAAERTNRFAGVASAFQTWSPPIPVKRARPGVPNQAPDAGIAPAESADRAGETGSVGWPV